MIKTRYKFILYSILSIYAVFTLFPFLWALSGSFKTYKEITSGSLNLIPANPSFLTYIKLITVDGNFPRWIFNSFFIGTVGTFINVMFNTMAGYALARLRFRGRDFVLNVILVSIMVPGQVLLIPNYLIVQWFGLMNSYTAVLLPAAVNATYIYMMRQFFINFPKEVEEAASIDGLGRLGVFFRIAMPLARPAISTQAVFVFMGFWNTFLQPKLYLQDPQLYTLTVGIQTMMSRYGGITQWEEVLAASVISMIPILIIYIILNKKFIQGVRMDGEK